MECGLLNVASGYVAVGLLWVFDILCNAAFFGLIAQIHKFEGLVAASTCTSSRPVQRMFKYLIRFREFPAEGGVGTCGN